MQTQHNMATAHSIHYVPMDKVTGKFKVVYSVGLCKKVVDSRDLSEDDAIARVQELQEEVISA